MAIHPTAIIDRSAMLDPSVEVGPYAIVERNVQIGAGTRLFAHAYISEGTTLGERCQIHPFAIVGHCPQDVKFEGAPSYTRVGDDTIVREHAQIHRGTLPGSTTTVGRSCFVMAGGHIGHNCQVGDHVVIANNALLGGHVEVGQRAFLSGHVGLHQFMRVGELAMIGGGVVITQDVPPFMLVHLPQVVLGTNVVGLRRAGISSAECWELRRCHRLLYRCGLPFFKAVEQVEQLVQTDAGRRLVQFLRSPSRRGFLRSRRWGGANEPIDDEP